MNFALAKDMKSPQEIVELWKAIRIETISWLNKVPDDKFQERPTNRWSISEVAEHLYLSQWTTARPLPIILAGKFGEDVGPQPNLEYEKIRETFSKPSGVKNPEVVNPLNNYSKEEIFALLEKSEKKMEDALKGKKREDLEKRGIPHPFFGLLNNFNFFWVMALHEYSHLVAIK
ncbi:MAG: DinB family protein, partial [Leptospiraceae bacterium]|nr:DinB family protein [Leptospiraceae bacterium]